METALNLHSKDLSKTEFLHFINEGLQDVSQNRLLDFDTIFDELEERYHTNE